MQVTIAPCRSTCLAGSAPQEYLNSRQSSAFSTHSSAARPVGFPQGELQMGRIPARSPASIGPHPCARLTGTHAADQALSPSPVAPFHDGRRVRDAAGLPVLRHAGRAHAVGRRRHRLAFAHRRMDSGARARAGSRYLLFYPVRATVVCLGVVVGCAVRLAASACRHGGGGVGEQPGPGVDFRSAVPHGAPVERCAGGAGVDAGCRGRLGRTLAGASAPVHHVVHGDLLFHPGAAAARVRARAGVPRRCGCCRR